MFDHRKFPGCLAQYFTKEWWNFNPSHIPLSIALFISLNNFDVARLEEKTIAIIYEKKVIFWQEATSFVEAVSLIELM